jgi:poly(hydroxyalkanoate) granule-associated protein
MSEQVEHVEVAEEAVAENGHNSVLELTRRVLLAGVGAVALAQEEIEGLVNKLVERGEIAEKDGRKLIKDIVERRRERATEVRTDTQEQLDRRMEQLLSRMNIPTKSDVRQLNEKIVALTKKVDALAKKQS